MLKKLTLITGILATALWLYEFFFIHPHHPVFWWHYLKGFPILLGLAGGAILMFGAKALGKYWLYRKEDYYD